jgi:hypothetical protein
MHLRKKKKYKRMRLLRIDLIETLAEPGSEELRAEMQKLLDRRDDYHV